MPFVLAAQKLGIELVVASFGEAYLTNRSGGLDVKAKLSEPKLSILFRGPLLNIRLLRFWQVMMRPLHWPAWRLNAMGCPGNPADAIKALTSKIHFRRFCKSTDILGPWIYSIGFRNTSIREPHLEFNYPCVAKPAIAFRQSWCDSLR